MIGELIAVLSSAPHRTSTTIVNNSKTMNASARCVIAMAASRASGPGSQPTYHGWAPSTLVGNSLRNIDATLCAKKCSSNIRVWG